MLSVTVFYKKTFDGFSRSCDIHFHLSQYASGFDGLDGIVDCVHIKKISSNVGGNVEQRIQVKAHDALEFLKKCKTRLGK